MRKPLVLFDLNGTLISRSRTKMQLRPGIEHLYLLKGLFDLGIYTSMTSKNAFRAVAEIGASFAGLFDEDCVLLHRGHTKIIGRPKPWSTVKPVRTWLPDHPVVFVVDDTPEKALPDEASQFLHVPTWTGGDDDVLHGLTQYLLDVHQALDALRVCINKICSQVNDD